MEHPEIKRKRILVVDDDALNRKLFTAMLAARGHQVFQAVDGACGIDIAYREHPDLIIMDVQMPGMSGLDATHSLKSEPATCDIPVIIATAYSLDEDEIRGSGCDHYLTKPITVSEFIDAVDAVVERTERLAEPVG